MAPSAIIKGSGRPHATSHAAIEAQAFALFRERGFDNTTMEDIAEAVGVGRRTLFRYYPSKNDIPWGRFDAGLVSLQHNLDAIPGDVPVLDAVQRAVVEFNRLEPGEIGQHRQRMTLLLRTPALLAHSVHRYAEWRSVVADFAARRYGLKPDDQLPRTVGHVSLALSLSAYEQWLREPRSDLSVLLESTAVILRAYVADMRGDDGAPLTPSGWPSNLGVQK